MKYSKEDIEQYFTYWQKNNIRPIRCINKSHKDIKVVINDEISNIYGECKDCMYQICFTDNTIDMFKIFYEENKKDKMD